ncbi:MAG: transposase [Trichormus sp.]
MKSALLEEFRQAAYKHLGRAHDATFELTDAILLTRNAYSLADLSLSPVFRRKWPSIYEAIEDSRPQRQKLMQLYIKQMPTQDRPLLAGDHTAWSRPDAPTLQERTIEHSSVKSLRSNSKLKIQNSKLKTISGGLYPPLIEYHQIGDFGGGLYPKLLNSKKFLFFILNFEFCILN